MNFNEIMSENETEYQEEQYQKNQDLAQLTREELEAIVEQKAELLLASQYLKDSLTLQENWVTTLDNQSQKVRQEVTQTNEVNMLLMKQTIKELIAENDSFKVDLSGKYELMKNLSERQSEFVRLLQQSNAQLKNSMDESLRTYNQNLVSSTVKVMGSLDNNINKSCSRFDDTLKASENKIESLVRTATITSKLSMWLKNIFYVAVVVIALCLLISTVKSFTKGSSAVATNDTNVELSTEASQ